MLKRSILIVRPSTANHDSWDQFAAKCGASFRCAYSAARVWHRSWRVWKFDFQLYFKLRRFEIFLTDSGSEVKIGQCAVGVGRTRSIFADSLQLAPEYQYLWSEALMAVVRMIGPGTYQYGSDWNLEKSREKELSDCPGIQLVDIQKFAVEYVDFSAWPDWDKYFAAVSENVRRNVKKASKYYPDFHIEEREGFNLRGILQLTFLRQKMFKRKRLGKSFVSIFSRSVVRNLAVSKYLAQAYFISQKRVVAAHCGLEFGSNTFYLEGGAEDNNQGAAWNLLMTMIKKAWAHSEGRGTFIMGPDDPSLHEDSVWKGLVRSRQQCRVTSLDSSVINFSYQPAETISAPAELSIASGVVLAEFVVRSAC